MLSSVIPARLVFQCGHAALVSLPRVKGETSTQRADRVAREKSAAQLRACDFCAQRLEVVVQHTAPAPLPASLPTPPPTPLPTVFSAAASVPEAVVPVVPVVAIVAVEPVAAPPPALVEAVAVPPAARVVVPRRRPAAKKPAAQVVSQPVAPVVKQPVAPAVKKLVRRPRGPAIHVAPPAQNGKAARGTRFTVQFQAQAVLRAADLRDALRQAQALGAIEVVAITREK
jgi:hypothetical protein